MNVSYEESVFAGVCIRFSKYTSLNDIGFNIATYHQNTNTLYIHYGHDYMYENSIKPTLIKLGILDYELTTEFTIQILLNL